MMGSRVGTSTGLQGIRMYGLAVAASLVMLHASIGMLGVWAALSRLPWYVRLGVLFAITTMLIRGDMHDIAAFLLFSATGTVAGIGLIESIANLRHRSQTGRKHLPRFRLLDFLFATVTVAVFTWLCVALKDALSRQLPAIAATGSSLSVIWATAERWRTPSMAIRWTLVILAVLIQAALWLFRDWLGVLPTSVNAFERIGAPRPSFPLFVIILAAGEGLVIAWLKLWRPRATTARTDEAQTEIRSSTCSRLGAISLIGAVLAPIALFCWHISRPFQFVPPIENLPHPNAVDELMAVNEELRYNRQLSGLDNQTLFQGSPFSARADFAEKYGAVVEGGRAALDRPWAVPFERLVDGSWNVEGLRRGFAAMYLGRWYQDNYDQAAAYALAQVKLEAGCQRYRELGDILDTKAERFAIYNVTVGASGTNAEYRKSLIEELARIDANRPNLEEQNRLQWKLYEYKFGPYATWKWRWMNEIRTLLGVTRLYDMNREKRLARDTWLQLGRVTLALYAFVDDHGKLPKALDELTPDYLPELPDDPFSHKPFVYRIEGNELLLYSVGPNRVDDGGARASWAQSGDVYDRSPVDWFLLGQ